jgi:type I restriction enzyme M protein
MQKEYYTVGKAAELLGVTSTTLRNWEKSGRLIGERDEENKYRKYPADKILALQTELNSASGGLILPPQKVLDVRGLRFIVRQLSKTYRDSQGGNLLERFEEISKLIFAKLYDENNSTRLFAIKKNDTFQSVFERINNLYQEAQSLLLLDKGTRETLKPDLQAVFGCVKILSEYNLKDVPTDVKGFIYEELIKNTFDKTDNQQFFTPRTIVQFMVELSEPHTANTIMDPACGSGGFLISALPHLATTANILGLEIDPMMARISQMNLVMNGARRMQINHLRGAGSLSHSAELAELIPNESVDLILTNPPFGSDFTDSSELSKYILGKGKKSRRRGVLFLERCLEWLKPGGRLCVVIDEGVLNGDGNSDVRNLILQNSNLEAVISLPEAAFMPYATVKTSILVLRKKSTSESVQGKVFMAAANNVGRKPNGDPLYSHAKNSVGEPELVNDLPKILQAWKNYQNGIDIAQSEQIFLASLDENSKSARFDLPFYHPLRYAAQRALRTAKYKTYRLGELVTVRNISLVPAIQEPDEKLRFIGLADISPKTGRYEVQEILGSQLKSAVKMFKAGDILFSKMRPELQKCSYILPSEDEGYTSAENVVLALNDNDQLRITPSVEVMGEYLALILRSEIGLGQILHQITGVGRPRIGLKTLLSIQIPLPSLDEQRKIVAAHDEAWAQHLSLKEKGRAMLEQAQSLVETFYTSTVDKLITR